MVLLASSSAGMSAAAAVEAALAVAAAKGRADALRWRSVHELFECLVHCMRLHPGTACDKEESNHPSIPRKHAQPIRKDFCGPTHPSILMTQACKRTHAWVTHSFTSKDGQNPHADSSLELGKSTELAAHW